MIERSSECAASDLFSCKSGKINFLAACLAFALVGVKCANADADIRLRLFQRPPQPLAIWPEPVPLPDSFQRPKFWEDKNFGQWCRNFTVDRHTQCPEATPFHWYVCCGEHNVECCGGPQTWTYLIFGLTIGLFLVFVFYLLLHFNFILKPANDKDALAECEKANSGKMSVTARSSPRIRSADLEASEATLLRFSAGSPTVGAPHTATTTMTTCSASPVASTTSSCISCTDSAASNSPPSQSPQTRHKYTQGA